MKVPISSKVKGKTNLTEDGKCIFLALEEIFRNQYPENVTNMEQSNFTEKCLNNHSIQNCFHSATDHVMSDKKKKVLLDIISLFFKVRVHHKCKIIIENIRRKKVDSQKQKSLHSKLTH